jgi:hypothetical protein
MMINGQYGGGFKAAGSMCRRDAPMVVKALFQAGEKSRRGCWVAEAGQDRDGPLAVEGRLL